MSLFTRSQLMVSFHHESQDETNFCKETLALMSSSIQTLLALLPTNC